MVADSLGKREHARWRGFLAPRSPSPRGLNLKTHTLFFLKVGGELKQVVRLRIAVWTEPAHKALGRAVYGFGKLAKADGRVDVIAENRRLAQSLRLPKERSTPIPQSFPLPQ